MLLNILITIAILVLVLIFVVLILLLGLSVRISEKNVLHILYLYCENRQIKNIVSALSCPTGAIEHFWHDGCVECDSHSIVHGPE